MSCFRILTSVLVFLFAQDLSAQTKRQDTVKTIVNPAAIRALDIEAEQMQRDFIDSLEDVAKRYEEAGDLDKAQATLDKVLGLDPHRTHVKQKLEEMRNQIFEGNEVEVDVDVTRGWVSSGIKTKAGEPIRIVAEGAYKLILNTTVTPDGISTDDLNRDMVDSVTLGELMGVIFPPPKGRQKPKPGKPFSIGSQLEFTPEESGMLFLRLNVPSGSKSNGSVKVTISGNYER